MMEHAARRREQLLRTVAELDGQVTELDVLVRRQAEGRQDAKTLGKNEKQSSAKASMPNYALTTRDVVIDRMTPKRGHQAPITAELNSWLGEPVY
jgi:phage terminase large subunit-like protein